MKLSLVAVGTNMPSWVETGFNEYQKRLPREYKFECVEVAIARRNKNANLQKLKDKEGEDILARTSSSSHVVALDVHGRSISTEQLAKKLEHWQLNGRDVAIIVGGPDGLSQQCLDRADEVLSLSNMTLPHPMVRIIVAEQLYRACAILQNHPYHK